MILALKTNALKKHLFVRNDKENLKLQSDSLLKKFIRIFHFLKKNMENFYERNHGEFYVKLNKDINRNFLPPRALKDYCDVTLGHLMNVLTNSFVYQKESPNNRKPVYVTPLLKKDDPDNPENCLSQ